MKGLIERDHKLYIRKVYRDSTGKKKQIWRKVETRSEGKTLLREIENDLANGTESFENRDSLDSYLDKWLSMSKGTILDRTHGDYESLLRLYFRPVLGKKRLTSVITSARLKSTREGKAAELTTASSSLLMCQPPTNRLGI